MHQGERPNALAGRGEDGVEHGGARPRKSSAHPHRPRNPPDGMMIESTFGISLMRIEL